MRRLWITTLAIATSFTAFAEAARSTDQNASPPTLIARLLEDREPDRPARPIGSCVFVCGDRLIEVERCPNGDCPEFNCNTRVQACPVR